jgi:hypothetical protein
MKKIIILLIIFIETQIGCNPCPSDTLNITPLPTKVLEYFNVFQPGNYWVYENQTGTKRDTVRVTANKISQIFRSYDGCLADETRVINFTPSFIFTDNYTIDVENTTLVLTRIQVITNILVAIVASLKTYLN